MESGRGSEGMESGREGVRKGSEGRVKGASEVRGIKYSVALIFLVGTGKCHWHLNLEKSQPLILPLVILSGYECPFVLNLLLLLSKE